MVKKLQSDDESTLDSALDELLADEEPGVDPDIKKRLVKQLNAVQDKYSGPLKGRGSLSPATNLKIPEVMPTGIPEIDHRLLSSIGGLPLGRAIELGGETSAGKTTLALNWCREAIKMGRVVAIAENEGSLTYEYGEKIGLDRDSYLIFKGDGMSGNEYLEAVLKLFESGVDFLVLDSINGIISDEAADAGLTDSSMNTEGANAKLVAKFFRLLKNGWPSFAERAEKDAGEEETKSKFSKRKKHKRCTMIKYVDSGATLIVINHLKPIFGQTSSSGFQPKETSGNQDIKFLYSLRIWLERIGMTKERDADGDPIFTRSRLSIAKNKLGVPARSCMINIDNRNGRIIADNKVIVGMALTKGILKQSKSWYEVMQSMFNSTGEFLLTEGEKFQGSENFVNKVLENPELYKQIVEFDNAEEK